MKKILLLIALFSTLLSFSQNPYESGTLTFRDGNILEGDLKILLDNRTIKFRNSERKKKEYNYTEIEELKIVKDYVTEIYKYKIIVGMRPKLLRVIKETKGKLNLYAIDFYVASEFNKTGSPIDDFKGYEEHFREYYVSKGNEDIVIKLGSDRNIFGSQFFKKTAMKYFKDCPTLIKKIKNKEFNRQNDIKNIVEFYNENCGKQTTTNTE